MMKEKRGELPIENVRNDTGGKLASITTSRALWALEALCLPVAQTLPTAGN